MRFIEVGVGSDGKSHIAEVRDLAVPEIPAGGVKGQLLWSTSTLPPEVTAPRRAADANWMNVGLGEGASRWMIAHFAAGHVAPMHHTSTLDYDIIVAGEITLGTESGEIVLLPGDCVLVPGCMHSWIAGAAGCTMATVLLGLSAVS